MIFGREFIMQLLGVYMAFVYGIFYCPYTPSFFCLFFKEKKNRPVFLTTMTPIFTENYHESVGIAGLHFFALGIGVSGAAQVSARVMDRIYVYFKGRNEGVGEPEFRLREFHVFILSMSMSLSWLFVKRRWVWGV